MKTILQILRQAGGWHHGLYLKIENPPYMALVIEATDESGPCGLPAISVCHYGEQNGDLMRDPEMCFEFGLAGGVHLNPFYYRNDYVGMEQWSRTIVRDSYVYLVSLHQQHERFAKVWDNNLRLQGFAEAFEQQQTPRAETFPAPERIRKCVRSTRPMQVNRSRRAAMNTQTATEYRNLPLNVLTESTNNPRRIFEDAALKELAESIRVQGVLSPLLVRPITEQGFEIVAGARRYRAAQIAEVTTVPVRIVNLTAAEAMEAALIENLQRRDVHPLEEAQGLRFILHLVVG